MKIALPVWKDNVSSVLDFAETLLLVELGDGLEIRRDEIVFTEQSSLERAAKLRQLGVNVLICGAISRQLAYMLSSFGIEVLPFITGSVEQIIKAYMTGNLSLPQYAMPGGCWEGARRCYQRRRGRRGRKWQV
ncbi:MAG: NifB/NifX family molybdenum-iron cluster-binding protein [Sedimentisphaerales bacterium]|nr:NifB/NifX family molybdenum-iron cluster-binding protein [Sedimentisphaerales bacterium]